jgi:hypothetical protein
MTVSEEPIPPIFIVEKYSCTLRMRVQVHLKDVVFIPGYMVSHPGIQRSLYTSRNVLDLRFLLTSL